MPDCRIVLITGEDDNQRKLEEWEHLLMHSFLMKPFTAERLLDAISEALVIDGGKSLREWIEINENERNNTVGEEDEDRMPSEDTDMSETEALRKLASVKPGAVIHIFELHPRSFRARSVANIGSGLRWEKLKGKIGKSRIKDAAFEKAPMIENVSGFAATKSHLWTRHMMYYRTFCGVPFRVSGSSMRHALVAFHAEENAFDGEFRSEAILCAERIARFLERQRLLKRRQNETAFAASGMTLGSFSHELFNHLSSTDIQAIVLGRLLDGDNPLAAAEDQEEAKMRISAIRSKTKEAVEKTEVLRGIKGESKPVSIQNCLRHAAIACQSTLQEISKRPEDIEIKVPEEVHEEWLVKAIPASLIIVFFNLYLNAVQQIDLAGQIRKRGHVWHSLERRVRRDGNLWAFVRIHDTGPGIHPDDWDNVFEPGYTTKDEGTGLGLHICSYLLNSIQESGRRAELCVTRSTIWDGTTFTVKIPLSD